MEQKTCTACGAEKPATREFFHSAGKGRLHAKCIVCVLEYSMQYAARKSVSKNAESATRHWCLLQITCSCCGLETPHWFRSGGKMKCQACEAIRRYPDRERPPFDQYRARLMLAAESKYLRRYCKKNKCQSCGVIHKFDKTRRPRWQHVCPDCERLHIRIYRQTHKAKKRDAIGDAMRKAIKCCGESPTVKAALGYSIGELKSHLERQFLPGMTWELFAEGKIHIDHITPQAAFDLSDDAQWRSCWSLGNLRPMWAKENIAKGAKQVFLL